MSSTSKAVQAALPQLAGAKTRMRRDPNILAVSIGYKYEKGKRTDKIGIIFTVREKKKPEVLADYEVIPKFIDAIPTDVTAREEYKILSLMKFTGDAQSLTNKMRPCPPGYSISHPQVTAGTLGGYTEDQEGFSNNHVAANSNDAKPGDFIWQPGRVDGGSSLHRFGKLSKFAAINFIGGGDKKGGKSSAALKGARLFWSLFSGPPNFLAKHTGCTWRLQLRPSAFGDGIKQPDPNLIDGAVFDILDEADIDLVNPVFGQRLGVTDLLLGDEVEKNGRTTSYTVGLVEEVFANARVGYGSGKTALYENQVIIRGINGDFSAGGDSGSGIYKQGTGLLGGVLFAGGGGVTIANRISDFARILSIRL